MATGDPSHTGLPLPHKPPLEDSLLMLAVLYRALFQLPLEDRLFILAMPDRALFKILLEDSLFMLAAPTGLYFSFQ